MMDKKYACPVCGKIYGSIVSLQECINKHAENEKKAIKAEEETKKNAAKEKINEIYKQLKALTNSYNKTYGGNYTVYMSLQDTDNYDDNDSEVEKAWSKIMNNKELEKSISKLVDEIFG